MWKSKNSIRSKSKRGLWQGGSGGGGGEDNVDIQKLQPQTV